MNALAKTLHAAGAKVYAPDLRGHGSSGRRGDIDYIGQLDDDRADLLIVATIRPEQPHATMTLIGFSGGGAFTIRIVGGPNSGQVAMPDNLKVTKPFAGLLPASGSNLF